MVGLGSAFPSETENSALKQPVQERGLEEVNDRPQPCSLRVG